MCTSLFFFRVLIHELIVRQPLLPLDSLLWYVLMTLLCVFTAKSAAFCCELSSSASGRHRERVNNSVLRSAAASLLMTKKSNLPGDDALMQDASWGSRSLCRNKLDGFKTRAEWLCALSGRSPVLSWRDYYPHFNIPRHLLGNVICIHAGIWHILSACCVAGEERLRVYRGSCAFSLDFSAVSL